MIDEKINLQVDNEEMVFSWIDSGVPHAVAFVDDLEIRDFEKKGKEIRYHPSFLPSGVNVDFACMQDTGNILVRTYERGVEEETYSCGTGALAVAFAFWKKNQEKHPLHLHFKRGEYTIFLEKEKIFLIGSSSFVYSGNFPIKEIVK